MPAVDPELAVRDEIEFLRQLKHKNVVQLLEVIEQPKKDLIYLGTWTVDLSFTQPLVVFEMCEYGALMSLSMNQKVKPLSRRLARYFFLQLVEAVVFRKLFSHTTKIE